MTTEQMIEEAVTKHRKILAEATTFDEMAIKTEKLIRDALTTIATKSAEEERKIDKAIAERTLGPTKVRSFLRLIEDDDYRKLTSKSLSQPKDANE